MTQSNYQGTEVLENLKEAVNYNSSLVRLIKKHAPKMDKLRILDFGAGIGTFAEKARDELGNVDCFEIDQGHIQDLKNKGFVVFSDFKHVKDDDYNFIYSLNVLEHIENDQEAFDQLLKKLKPGGTMFIFVPAFNMLYSPFDKYVGHYRRYKVGMLEELASRTDSKIRVKDSSYFDFIGFFAAWAYKLVHKEFVPPKLSQITLFDRIFFPLNRIFDLFFSGILGKNAFIVVEKISNT